MHQSARLRPSRRGSRLDHAPDSRREVRSRVRPASRSPKARCGATTARSSSRASRPARCTACGPSRTAPSVFADDERRRERRRARGRRLDPRHPERRHRLLEPARRRSATLPAVAAGDTRAPTRARPTARSRYLADDGFHGPNDLAVAADGDVYFTDPGHYPPPDDDLVGRVMVYERDGIGARRSPTASTTATASCSSPTAPSSSSKRRGLQRVHADGSREWVIETLGPGGGDGFCLDADGRFYVASTIEHGIRVVEPDGTIARLLADRRRGPHAPTAASAAPTCARCSSPTRSPATSSRSKACRRPASPSRPGPGPS